MIIAGNWKMNLTREAAGALAREVAAAPRDGVEVILFPPFTMLDVVREAIGDSGVMLGGQDCHHQASGAHTGDVSAAMLKDAGCDWVLLGHSERRQNHGESSALVRSKAEAARAAGLKIMLCVGETLEQRETGRAEEVVQEQISESMPGSGVDALAYEPVWAIGTGKTASNDDIATMHGMIAGRADTDALYGGSVKPDNAGDILGIANVGGALVGGASLKVKDFTAIINAAK